MKISDLKVGSKLFFGSYGTHHDTIHPITWLKASRDNEFLSEFVLDILMFDAKERENPDRDMYWYGNGNYELSNIIQFMNSSEDDWYEPMHDYDFPPGNQTGSNNYHGEYINHSGFLHDFEDYELDCLASRIDLPSSANVFGAGGSPRFQLFSRKGVRGRPHPDVIANKYNHDLTENSFCAFWLSDQEGKYTVSYIDRNGSRRREWACHSSGFRPKCTLKADLEVEPMPDGSGYRVVAFDVDKSKVRRAKVCTDEEFLALMGLL